MTPTQKQAMEMALEALETELRGYFGPSPRLTRVIEALRAAQAEQDDDKADMTADSTEVRPGFYEWHGGRYAGLQLAIAQAAWDAAVAAERERCAKHLDALGCDHCAAALRMSPNAKLGDGKQ